MVNQAFLQHKLATCKHWMGLIDYEALCTVHSVSFAAVDQSRSKMSFFLEMLMPRIKHRPVGLRHKRNLCAMWPPLAFFHTMKFLSHTSFIIPFSKAFMYCFSPFVADAYGYFHA